MTADTDRNQLIAARARLAKGFCKGRLATDAQGAAVDVSSPRAAQWCVLGALLAGCGGTYPSGISALLVPHLPASWQRRYYAPDMCTLVDYNNDALTTQADMVGLFDKALAV